MSDFTSQNSPTSDPSSAEVTAAAGAAGAAGAAFEGTEDVLRAWGAGLRPDADLTVSEWSDRHRMLSNRASAEPGRYRTARTPYMGAIMDALSTRHPAQRVVFMKAAQVGATEAGNNWIGYVIHQAPGPMLAVQPTVELAKRNSRQRIDPLIEESAALRDRVKPARSRDAGNTMLSKEFDGGILIMTGANSAVGLRSTPARYLFLDEVDAYPASADEEGDPVSLAEMRSLTFAHRRKVFLVSTPTIRGRSRIEREFEASDQRRYHVPCPHCGQLQWLKFERLRWEKGHPETAAYLCEGCDEPIPEHHKSAMLSNGEWLATANTTDPDTIGFHLSALYSPVGWLSWARIARGWEAAQVSDEAHKVFRNTVLAQTWEERGEAPDWQRLYDRREVWPVGTVPTDGLVLTSFTDVQGDRLETSVWAWGEGLESWLIEHAVIRGAPNEAETWLQLHDLLNDRTWRQESGHLMRIAVGMVDSGAYTSEVYKFIRSQDARRIHASKGQKHGKNVSWIGSDIDDATRRHGGRKIRNIATSSLKHEFYRQLRLERPTRESGDPFPAGYVHLSEAVPEDGCRQLVSEVYDAGKGVWSVRQSERNEWLDCRVGARAAAYWAGVDMMSEDDWQSLRDEYAGPTPEQVRAAPERHRREPAPRKDNWIPRRDKRWL
ncbi:phage terminase large subunit family protein [Emcibacter sp. SYSU 3D8]|uniref:phage terminase large subunit family protein n=1 Tax=Emcibacter sp. SYSU 3D8 TaxID=3133969 RepID=UPI0031FE8227